MSADGIKIFELLDVLDRLKHLKRTGWIHYNVPEPETVAGHMYRMAVLAMSLQQEQLHDQDSASNGNGNATPKIDVTRCLKIALLHDIGEAIVGDITPRCGVSSDEKFKLEENALHQIASYVPPWVGEEWLALWMEYEAATTAEARVVKQLDKFDMIAQAYAYELKYGMDLSEFFDSTPAKTFTTEPFIGWSRDLRAKRAETKKDRDLSKAN